MFSLQEITQKNYLKEKKQLFSLVDKIWIYGGDAAQAKHSINRWGVSHTESGLYFYIMEGLKPIGITGYFIPSLKEGIFGLRHHGTLVKGTGRKSLKLLFDYLEEKYGTQFKFMVELVPKGREDLVGIFSNWGFKIDPQGVPDWEPKKEYYECMMVLKRRK